MQYVVVCENQGCRKRYTPSGDQLAWIERAAREGYRFIMLRCEQCGHQMGFNPQHSEGYLKPEPTHLCCPIETCDGLVVELPDHLDERRSREVVYGCGECGNEWTSKADLDRDISTIVGKYPYRAACYAKGESGWLAVEYDQLPENYHELVAGEWANIKE